MAGPKPDPQPDPIGSTFQFRAFALRGEAGEVGETSGRGAKRGLLILAALFAALVLAVIVTWALV